jgi:hypothetical protein
MISHTNPTAMPSVRPVAVAVDAVALPAPLVTRVLSYTCSTLSSLYTIMLLSRSFCGTIPHLFNIWHKYMRARTKNDWENWLTRSLTNNQKKRLGNAERLTLSHFKYQMTKKCFLCKQSFNGGVGAFGLPGHEKCIE